MFFKFICGKFQRGAINIGKDILAFIVVMLGLLGGLISLSMVFGLVLWSITFGQLFNLILWQSGAFEFYDLGVFGTLFMIILFIYTFAINDFVNMIIRVANEYKTYKRINHE